MLILRNLHIWLTIPLYPRKVSKDCTSLVCIAALKWHWLSLCPTSSARPLPFLSATSLREQRDVRPNRAVLNVLATRCLNISQSAVYHIQIPTSALSLLTETIIHHVRPQAAQRQMQNPPLQTTSAQSSFTLEYVHDRVWRGHLILVFGDWLGHESFGWVRRVVDMKGK